MTNKYDLEERTAKFGEEIVQLCKQIPKDVVTLPLINQIVKSGTSIGANYSEANGGSSKKDFKNKIFICKKEGKETMYWLRILITAVDEQETKNKCLRLLKESHELTLIFSKIAANTNLNI